MGSPAPKGDSSSTPPPKPPNRLPNANFMKPSFKEKVVGQPLEPNVVHNLVEETFLRLELKEEADREKVMNDALGWCLIITSQVQPWSPKLSVADATIDKTLFKVQPTRRQLLCH
ncbi:uncharacterized protein [Glycine max]|uniref:uncharacterized protein n=1 Tax=Glycine max TaxID=3847 RepID=UPI001B35800A|nr:uncharacterized protein LOC106799645 [Glycine max]